MALRATLMTPEAQLPKLPKGFAFKRQGSQWLIVELLDEGRAWRPLSEDALVPAIDPDANKLLPLLQRHIELKRKDLVAQKRLQRKKRAATKHTESKPSLAGEKKDRLPLPTIKPEPVHIEKERDLPGAMTMSELALNVLANTVARDLHIENGSQGLAAIEGDLVTAGKIVSDTRRQIEKARRRKSVVSPRNMVNEPDGGLWASLPGPDEDIEK